MPQIAIVGVGAIGAAVAATLEDAGHEVLLCTRQPLPQRRLERPEGATDLRGENLLDPDQAPPVDWILVATKAYDVAGVARWLDRLRARDAPVAVLQNGVEHRERFAPFVPVASILPVVVNCPVHRPAAGPIRQRGPVRLAVPDGVMGRGFADLFAGTAAQVAPVANFEGVAWKKLCLNAVGILPALLLQPAGVLRGDDLGEVAREIVRECVAVGRAEGVSFDDDTVEEVLRAVRASAPDSINSLQADRLAGRRMEIDARNGAIVRKGKAHGVPTPVNLTVVAILEAMASTPVASHTSRNHVP